MTERAVLGFSGGKDSLATAIILKRAGYDLLAVTLDVCSGNDDVIEQAIKSAAMLGIEHRVVNVREEFERKVIIPFVDNYMQGYTPAPCSVCNNHIKWEVLRRVADREGIEKLATGHYIRIEEYQGRHYIYRGKDKIKDQSYFLWELPQEILSRAITPLGDYTKDFIRHFLKKEGYSDSAKGKESMGVCFLGNQDYTTFLKTYHPDIEINPGEGCVYDDNGNILGKHRGVPFYTVGQKKGLDLSVDGMYVKTLNSSDNSITVCAKKALNTHDIMVKDFKFVNTNDILSDTISVNIRGYGLNPSGYAKIKQQDSDTLIVKSEGQAWAVAPGQPVVFYDGDRLIGGGIAKN